ncbi:MAG: hypothetical protein A2511_12860 [Deltaproteobacteria bacterium RIFOXYD12_FULL_50_9]|nr:MAG: hypothetical protein A2511_12860 [Deltaproteobacteria bacterium RIFOXYD12_FULL_50_9]
MKVLVVDDMREDRKLLRYIAERQGHEVFEAENGLEGVRVAIAERPDLIISDALMPVMDGFRFLRAIKADEALASIPFIFYSAAYQGKKDLELALTLGADKYIIKPLEPKVFWREVEETLNRGREMVSAVPKLVAEEEEYLRKYSEIVAYKLEQKIREVEEARRQLHTLVDNLPDFIARFDRSFCYTFVNSSITATFAKPSEQFIGKNIAEAAPGLATEQIRLATESIGRVFALGTPDFYEGPWLMPMSAKTFEIRNFPEEDGAGNVVSVLSIARDITERKRAEALLLNQAQELSEANIALKVLLDHSRRTESELRDKMLTNIENLTIPYLNQLENYVTQVEGHSQLNLVKNSIKDLATSFSGKLSSPVLGLTPREIQVADLIRNGRSNKEIAALLFLSVGTVEFYRDRIRNKLDIKNKKTNLRAYLNYQFKE